MARWNRDTKRMGVHSRHGRIPPAGKLVSMEKDPPPIVREGDDAEAQNPDLNFVPTVRRIPLQNPDAQVLN